MRLFLENFVLYRGGNFFTPGKNWMRNRLRMVSKVRNDQLGVFSGGGCYHPNVYETPLLERNSLTHTILMIFSGIVNISYSTGGHSVR